MRILSVVTLVSPQGEYGGPVRVAVNQARELESLGHSVTLCAATRGFPAPPAAIEGVPTRLFPARQVLPGAGFAGLAAPGLWRWLWRRIREFDICHIHVARDLVTLPAAAIARTRGVRYVLQTHGMIDPSHNLLAAPLDLALTRPVLRDAQRVLYLTGTERAGLVEVAGDDLRLSELPNGVPRAEARTATEVTEVLYLARLAPRKRPELFARVAGVLAGEFPDVRFALVGPDEGEGDSVTEAIAAAGTPGRIVWEGALAPEATLDRLRRAHVYVLPSVNEPYPMSVLEAMSVGLPVVITDTCGLAGIVRRSGAGLIIDSSREALEDAIRELLQDRSAADEMGRRGRRFVREELGMAAIARRLVEIYEPIAG